MHRLIERVKNMSPGGIAGFIAVLVAVGVTLFILGARFINTAPSLCESCHPALTQMWERSTVHPADRVTCYECHAQHPELPDSFNVLAYVRDIFIPEKYRASEERLESRCVECHEEIVTAEKERGKVIKVNHKKHLVADLDVAGQKVTMGCVNCHYNVAHDKAVIATNRPRMTDCFVADCHRKDRNRDNCLRCHYQQLDHKMEKTFAGAD